jgi:hypothetical protein
MPSKRLQVLQHARVVASTVVFEVVTGVVFIVADWGGYYRHGWGYPDRALGLG